MHKALANRPIPCGSACPPATSLRSLRPLGPSHKSPRTARQVVASSNNGTGALPPSLAVLAAEDPTHPSLRMDRSELWKRAIKLPMYSVAIIPILVAASCVFAVHGHFNALRTVGFMAASCCVIAWLNLSNDYFDSETGVDRTHKPESIVNLLNGNRDAVMSLATAFLTTGLGGLIMLLQYGGLRDDRVMTMLTLAISLGYIYQGPPFRLSYRGLGEPLCFLAFGPLATCAFYLAQLPPGLAEAGAALTSVAVGSAGAAAVPPIGVVAAVLVGLTTTSILFTSHFHQREGDLAAGKMSPIVRLGTARAAMVFRWFALIFYLGAALTISAKALPITAIGALVVSFPLIRQVVGLVNDDHDKPEVVKVAKFIATKWHIVFGVFLAIGIAAPRALGLTL